MKKLVSIMVAVVMMISSVSVFGASLRIAEYGPEVETVRGGCTYRVTVDNTDEVGSVMFVNDNYDVHSFLVVNESCYGYIYITEDKELHMDSHNVIFELIAEEDIGVSGQHVWVFNDCRSYDPVEDIGGYEVKHEYSADDFE